MLLVLFTSFLFSESCKERFTRLKNHELLCMYVPQRSCCLDAIEIFYKYSVKFLIYTSGPTEGIEDIYGEILGGKSDSLLMREP